MQYNWSEVESLIDFLDHVWIGIVIVLSAAVPSWLAARNHRSIKTIRDNVQNGHKVPMREDLDKMIIAVNGLTQSVKEIADDVSGLRMDLITERDSRKAQVDDLRGDVDRLAHRHRRRNSP